MKHIKEAKYYLEMKTHYIPVPYDDEPRRVRVLLPKDYEKELDRIYPVVYMHDGQNVFYSKEAFSGHSWKVIPTIKEHTDLPKMIVVGIDNAEQNRINEYAPWSATIPGEKGVKIGGGGVAYGEWIVEVLKPFIDRLYRTKPDRVNTLLAGSSMGGLITAYIGSAYPNVFGSLGVFSLASWISEAPFLDFIQQHPLLADNKVYIQVGTNEGDEFDQTFIEGQMNQQYIDSTLTYYQELLRSGHPIDQVILRLTADGIHHEKHWADHFVEFLYFAFNL